MPPAPGTHITVALSTPHHPPERPIQISIRTLAARTTSALRGRLPQRHRLQVSVKARNECRSPASVKPSRCNPSACSTASVLVRADTCIWPTAGGRMTSASRVALCFFATSGVHSASTAFGCLAAHAALILPQQLVDLLVGRQVGRARTAGRRQESVGSPLQQPLDARQGAGARGVVQRRVAVHVDRVHVDVRPVQ
eukprot:scaffold2860_cov106-Isochrysis_galbana.AAC.5